MPGTVKTKLQHWMPAYLSQGYECDQKSMAGKDHIIESHSTVLAESSQDCTVHAAADLAGKPEQPNRVAVLPMMALAVGRSNARRPKQERIEEEVASKAKLG